MSTLDGVAALDAIERRMLMLALLLALLTFSVVAYSGLHFGFLNPSVAQAHSGSFYGANEAWVVAGAWEWPQKEANWCGVANIEVVANYAYQLGGGQSDTPFKSGGQQRIANDLNSAAGISEWGYPSWNGIGPGFHADIARDGGTDPRSIAWGIFYESLPAQVLLRSSTPSSTPSPNPQVPPALPQLAPLYMFHDVIYHNSVTDAVAGMARTLERYHVPLSVTIAHGLHSDVVSGVYATNDPINSYPANVDAVNAWDPAVGTPSGGYQSAREVTWDSYTFNTNIYMWGSTYSSNNGYDPDPAVGFYTPNSQYPSHWINYRTDIEPDELVSVPSDFALNETGSVMTHP